MDKDIINHKTIIINQLNTIESDSSIDKQSKIKRMKLLYSYHNNKIREFQHERLIHLMITLFFAALVILIASSTIILSMSNLATTFYLYQLLTVVFVIVLIVELFYIIYYYRLENNIQKLYKITDDLTDRIGKLL